LSLQYFTSSQTFSHFFLQANGLLQCTQTLVGKSAFLTPFMVACDKNWSIDCRTYWKQLLSFADFIVCNLPLKRALESVYFMVALLQMFLAHPTVDPFAP
jgi:hypothetical protein